MRVRTDAVAGAEVSDRRIPSPPEYDPEVAQIAGEHRRYAFAECASAADLNSAVAAEHGLLLREALDLQHHFPLHDEVRGLEHEDVDRA